MEDFPASNEHDSPILFPWYKSHQIPLDDLIFCWWLNLQLPCLIARWLVRYEISHGMLHILYFPIISPYWVPFWLVVYLPLWKTWVRQLGWWHSQSMESPKIHVPNHQPVYNHHFLLANQLFQWPFSSSLCLFARGSLGIALVESNLQRVIPLLKLPWVPLPDPSLCAHSWPMCTALAAPEELKRPVQAGDGTTYYVQFWPEISYING